MRPPADWIYSTVGAGYHIFWRFAIPPLSVSVATQIGWKSIPLVGPFVKKGQTGCSLAPIGKAGHRRKGLALQLTNSSCCTAWLFLMKIFFRALQVSGSILVLTGEQRKPKGFQTTHKSEGRIR